MLIWTKARLAVLLSLVVIAMTASGQGLQAQVSQEIVLPTGNSSVVAVPATMMRISIGNPEVADVAAVTGTEAVVTGKTPGSTTLLIWDTAGGRSSFTIRVTADAPSLQREFERFFPDETIEASAIGNTVILTGQVNDPQVARKALRLAGTLGEDIQIIDNMSVPDKGQILLQVRFAEVSRSWQEEIGPTLITRDGSNLDIALGPVDNVRSADDDDDVMAEVFSDAVNFFIFHEPSRVTAFIQALESRGLFKSLAEPNLLAMPAESASFLAGGEFPFPVLQGGGQSNAVTVQFKEFGIRLGFVPDITNSGAIRLSVAPEVSSLDFANGLTISGFRIPSLLSRKARTVVELQDGQTFAIAGLVDNTLVETVSQVPILGDIPILGELFKSKDMRQNRSELLVLVTPRIVRPLDTAPPVPTDEPETWKWDKSIRNPDDRPAERGRAENRERLSGRRIGHGSLGR
jgi:pilus assembly protein CpaC